MTTSIEQLRKSQTLEVFTVTADRETGEWIGQPEATGQTTNAWDWAQREDTDAEHLDTYEHGDVTRAIRIVWA